MPSRLADHVQRSGDENGVVGVCIGEATIDGGRNRFTHHDVVAPHRSRDLRKVAGG